MLQSYVIEVNGTFIGAAVRVLDGFRFRAVHPQVDDLDGRTWRTLNELRRATAHLFTTGQHARQAVQAGAGDGLGGAPKQWRPTSSAPPTPAASWLP